MSDSTNTPGQRDRGRMRRGRPRGRQSYSIKLNQWMLKKEQARGAHGVAGLVVGDGAALLGADDLGALLEARDDAIGGRLEVLQRHVLLARARRHQRRLVHDVGDVGAAKTRRERGEAGRVVRQRLVQLDLPQMHPARPPVVFSWIPTDGEISELLGNFDKVSLS